MKRPTLIALATLAVAVLLVYISLVIYIRTKAGLDNKVKSDAIVVLGEQAIGGTSCYGLRCGHGYVPHPTTNICLIARVHHAVTLFKHHYAAKIVMSGGTDRPDNVNEAAAMKAIAVAQGVPPSDILLEQRSRSTYENLAFSQPILQAAGLHSVIIVTDPAVNARAGLVAAHLHYTFTLSPATATPCSHPTDYYVREPAALAYYFLLGRL